MFVSIDRDYCSRSFFLASELLVLGLIINNNIFFHIAIKIIYWRQKALLAKVLVSAYLYLIRVFLNNLNFIGFF